MEEVATLAKRQEARKRGYGRGSVSLHKASGRWQGHYRVQTMDADGMIKTVRRTFYRATQAEAHAELDRILRDQNNGNSTDPTSLTVADYLSRWLEDSAAHRVRPVTLESYQRYIRLHAIPHIGHVLLQKLTPMHLQRLYSDKLKTGKSRRTVQYLHAILHRALEQAVRWELLHRNPADAVDAPKPKRRPPTIWSPEQLRLFLAAIEGDPYETLYHLAVYTGCRRGELCALRWSDVDLEQGTIRINQTLEELDKAAPSQPRLLFEEPKTKKSRRSLPPPVSSVAMLTRHKRNQLEATALAKETGMLYTDNDLVFARGDGTPLAPSQVSHHFAIIRKRYDLPHIRLHDLRHSFATMLLGAGTHPKFVSEWMGHSTITLTMDTYSHVIPAMQAQITETVDDLLSNRPKVSKSTVKASKTAERASR